MQMISKHRLQKELANNRKIYSCACRFGVVGDQTRLRICYLLRRYPQLSVSEIADIIKAPISTVSHSLRKLKEIHAVVHRRKAKEVFYSLNNNQFTTILKAQLSS